ncbi:MAG: hypothetical protein ACFCU6_15080, partial [Balneolaceae bacterium]
QVILREDSRVVFQFPLEEGSNWISFETPFLQTRSVEQFIPGSESESGKKTVVIRVETPGLNFVSWFDILNTDGLLKRTLLYTLNGTDETGALRPKIHLRETFLIEDMND